MYQGRATKWMGYAATRCMQGHHGPVAFGSGSGGGDGRVRLRVPRAWCSDPAPAIFTRSEKDLVCLSLWISRHFYRRTTADSTYPKSNTTPTSDRP